MLEGGEAGRVGCVVNDVAEVNIDAKLVRKTGVKAVDGAGPGAAPPGKRVADLAETVELDNGCACCTAGDDLFQALAQLVTLSKKRGRPFDRIIIENSGVAEPANIRDRFQEAALLGLPILKQIRLQNMLTVVDSSAFFKEYASKDAIEARPDLGDAGPERCSYILHARTRHHSAAAPSLRVSRMVALVVEVGYSVPAMPSSTRYVVTISSPSTTRTPSGVTPPRRHRRRTRAA